MLLTPLNATEIDPNCQKIGDIVDGVAYQMEILQRMIQNDRNIAMSAVRNDEDFTDLTNRANKNRLLFGKTDEFLVGMTDVAGSCWSEQTW